MRNLIEAIASGNLISEVRALGVDESTIEKPSVSLKACIAELNNRVENAVNGRLLKSTEASIRHYLIEYALTKR